MSAHLNRFAGRVIAVTGGASGIGAACCALLAAQGARVAVIDRDGAGAAAVARRCGGHAYALDVADRAAVAALPACIEAELGPVAGLLTAAGIIQGAAVPPVQLPADQYDRVVAVNLRGTHDCCTAFGTPMAQRGHGAIVVVGSIAGIRSTPLHIYGPIKAAVAQLARNLAAEWGRSGVRVNCVAPGPVLTPALQTAIDQGQRDRATMEAAMASGRMVLPEEVAAVVAFLLSDEASAITGVELPVDHGWLVASSWTSFGGLRPARG